MDDVRRRPNRSWLFSSIASALALLAFWGFMAGNAEAAQFTDLISFGDSLSDVGNVAGITTPGIAPLVNGGCDRFARLDPDRREAGLHELGEARRE